MTGRIITGWKLPEAERQRLLAWFAPLYPDVIADHVTLRTGTDGGTPLPQQSSGEIVGEIDDGDGVQALVVRIGGTTRREDGSTYHITWSLDRARGRRPVQSNIVIAELGWRDLSATIPIILTPAHFPMG